MAIKSQHALRVLILTPHIHNYLTRHKPEALDAAIAALREELAYDEFMRVEELLAHLAKMSTASKKAPQIIAVEEPGHTEFRQFPPPKKRGRPSKPPEAKAPKPPRPPKPPKIKLRKPPKTQVPKMTIVTVRDLTPDLGPELPWAQRVRVPRRVIAERPKREPKPKLPTDTYIVELLRDAMGDKTQKRMARDIGMAEPHLCNVLNHKAPPGRKIYRFLGIPMPRPTKTFSGDEEL